MAPTGGPVDRTPPEIVESIPEPNTVNFDGESIRLVFSDYIDQASFQRALSFTPAFDTPPRLRWRGRRVDIQLQEPLRPNTTYILTLDTSLRNMQGAAFTSPATLAFSTGPVIDQGTITGLIVDPTAVRAASNMDVFAYIMPDTTRVPDIGSPPHYRTQTDEQGRFVLRHLPDQPFYVFGIEDRNRNRMADPGEPFAVPPSMVIRPGEDGGMQEPFTFHRARLDTVPPDVQRVRSLSNNRLAARFGEAVQLTDISPETWSVREADTDRRFTAKRVFQRAGDPSQVFLLMEDALPASALQLRPGAIADSAGNPAPPSWHSFTGESQPDTAVVRFDRFTPDRPFGIEDEVHVLHPRERPGIRLSEPVDDAVLGRALSVTDATGNAFSFEIITRNNTDLLIHLHEPSAEEMLVSFDARAIDGDEVFERRYRYLTPDETGSIAGVARSRADGPVHVELYDGRLRDPPLAIAQPDEEGRYDFDRLPEGTYRIRAFADLDTSGSWSGGSISPYRRADPYAWNRDSLRVRPRWETIADTLRIEEDAIGLPATIEEIQEIPPATEAGAGDWRGVPNDGEKREAEQWGGEREEMIRPGGTAVRLRPGGVSPPRAMWAQITR